MSRKTIFIIPGFRHKTTSIGYKKLKNLLKKEGYSPISIKIPWKQATIEQNTDYFLKKYKKISLNPQFDKKNIYVLGFSFGAIIAFLASTKIPVKGLILCSLSPFFKEDLPKINSKLATELQKKRYKSFSNLHARQLAKNTKAKKVMMLYGSKESKILISRVTRTYKQINTAGKYLFPIKKAEHNIADSKYLHAIHSAARTLYLL